MSFPRRLLCLATFAALALSRAHAEKPVSPELVASLENVRVTSGKVPNIEADFVLTNVGKRTISLAERWNSCGAYQWSFTVADTNGRILTFNNPQFAWYMNALSVFTILPGKSFQMKCYLCSWQEPFNDKRKEDRFCFDSHIVDWKPKSRSLNWMRYLRFPLTIAGKFSVQEIVSISSKSETVKDAMGAFHVPERRIATNWKGRIFTKPVFLFSK
jgi:hypothetical protein